MMDNGRPRQNYGRPFRTLARVKSARRMHRSACICPQTTAAPVGRRVPCTDMRTPQIREPEIVDWSGDEPTVLFVHGAGFHARCWDAVIERLPQRCVAVNLRGHGGVAAPPGPLSWRDFAADVIDACARADVRGAIGVGHSLGGYAVALAAALRPDLFRALLLIDPLILARGDYGRVVPTPPARRRAVFASPQALRERLVTRAPFSRWNARVLDDYCQFALDSDGALWCSPDFEAAIYATASAADADVYDMFGRVAASVQVLRSGRVDDDNPFSRSPTAAAVAHCFSHGVDAVDARYSHFIPMEAPVLVAEYVASLTESLAG